MTEHDLKYTKYQQHLEGWKNHKVGPPEKRIRVALFALGRIGLIHLENIMANPRVELVYCVETSKERRDYIQSARNLWHVKFIHSDDADQVFQDSTIDAVIIGTPTQTHYPLVIKALEAKKHVLCEKPLAHDYEGMAHCYKTAEKNGVVLLTAFNRRFDPSFRDVQQRVNKGEIGEIRMIKSCARDSPRPTIEYLQSSGGIYHDCAVHDIDMILWIINEYPIRVTSQASAFCKDIKEIGDFDNVAIMMQFASGAIGLIDLNRCSSYGYDQRLEVFGPEGMLQGGNTRPHGTIAESAGGTNQVPYYYSFVSRYADAYTGELEHFVDCIKGKDELYIKPCHALASHLVAAAAEDSARLGKPIDLTWDPKLFVRNYNR